MAGRFEGKAALVTGAGSGIGLAAAELFAAEGAAEAVERAAGEFGRLDVVYNNAGVDSRGSVADAEEADWDRCFAVNVKGTFLCSRAAIPHLRARGGAIV